MLALAPLLALALHTGSPAPRPALPPAPSTRDTTTRRWTDADARFMQGMIAHHAQALRMTALVASRSTRKDVLSLAARIDASQRAEIAMMQQWLRDRGQQVPSAEPDTMPMAMDMAGMHHDMMPGMLTPEQMRELQRTRGTAFDWLFLTDMIQHHRGALTMVQQLLATPGAGQEPEAFRFASDVDSDQNAEIARMQRMLATVPKPGG